MGEKSTVQMFVDYKWLKILNKEKSKEYTKH